VPPPDPGTLPTLSSPVKNDRRGGYAARDQYTITGARSVGSTETFARGGRFCQERLRPWPGDSNRHPEMALVDRFAQTNRLAQGTRAALVAVG